MVGSFPVNGQKFPVRMRRELARKGMIMAGLFWQVRRGNAEASEISLYFPSQQGKCSNQSRSPLDGKSEWDGLLMASDIAALQTDADLVILSACNTAGPDGGPFADGFSGLARAFLHAGARSLLVSNWSVDSKATVELTTSFVRAIREAPRVRRADALRTSILKMLDGGDRTVMHPGFWAPFVV